MKNIFKILAVLSAVTAAVLVVVKYWDKINAKMQSIKNSIYGQRYIPELKRESPKE